ncbi:MAG: hypothetical protein U5J99_01155 [Parvularculaceae bacterium]|nr:hypothetical protein [Parvularculaceae bacterium]
MALAAFTAAALGAFFGAGVLATRSFFAGVALAAAGFLGAAFGATAFAAFFKAADLLLAAGFFTAAVLVAIVSSFAIPRQVFEQRPAQHG